DVVDGHGEVRQVFKLGKREQVAGSIIRDGKVTRNSLVKVTRGRETLVESAHIGSLKRLKDDAREVAAGYECGIVLEGFGEIQEGDIMEFYHKEKQ
ncbi:MAG: translation initiation factor IF-2, partial [Chloroflexi bacterium]|nr:translation initiation factor IF-2 [Chloroflexota bacterium]